MSFLQPWLLWALPLIGLPILIHLINQWRYQTKPWAAMTFLLQANRMNRGFARIRQWLILAMRTLALTGLIFAICRPLAGGFWSLLGGAQADTSIVLVDRSPSMQWQGTTGETKLASGKRQLADTLQTLGSKHWIGVDAITAESTTYDRLDALINSSSLTASSASSKIPNGLQSALEYLQVNRPGAADVWLCSDLQAGDWNADSGQWNEIRAGFSNLPQSVRFHLLAYPDWTQQNFSIRVTDAHRETFHDGVASQNVLWLSLQVFASTVGEQTQQTVPVQLEIQGVRSQLSVELNGASAELRQQRIALPAHIESGWGKVSLPADANNGDNDYYFVFDKAPVRRVTIVADDPDAVRPLQIAAKIAADGSSDKSQIELFTPAQVSSLELDGSSLLLWQAELPDSNIATRIDRYLETGGQVIFLPPAQLFASSSGVASTAQYRGVQWSEWLSHDQSPVMVTSWRGDQDLLAATKSGAGLPLGQLQIHGHATLKSDQPLTQLAVLDGGDSLLARLPTDQGGLYFCTAGASGKHSTLAENGVVLFVAVQRAAQQGEAALRGNYMRVASRTGNARSVPNAQPDAVEAIAQPRSIHWQQVAGSEALSSEFDCQSGIYRDDELLFAVNRPLPEDQYTALTDDKVAQLFTGLQLTRVDQQAGALGGIVREIWRQFLYMMIFALIIEAALCLPRGRTVGLKARLKE